jgi:glycosyltransferase involved in cell wall biosynthesis
MSSSPVLHDISIVATAYNEQECLPELIIQLQQLAATDDTRKYEFVIVDDGSTDATADVLRQLAGQDERVRPVILQRNFGQTAALAAGIDNARYPLIVTMDADLQNDPADIPLLLVKMQEGYDVVSGWRKQRQDKLFSRRLPSMMANALIGRVTGVRLHDYGCALKLYRADVLKRVQLYGELHRFVPALCAAVGARIAEIPVHHRARTAGRSKYGIGRTFRVVLDLLTVKFLLSYSTRPMHFFGMGAFWFFVFGFLSGTATIVMKLEEGMSMNRNPLFYLTIFMGFAGLQFLAVGLVAELIMRTYYESQAKRIYTTRVH